jgi:hypothetical protein
MTGDEAQRSIRTFYEVVNTDLVLCPLTVMATRSGLSALTLFLTAVRLKS